MAARKVVDPKTRGALCKRAEVALRELHLGSWTQADKTRLFRVERALHTLDEIQAELKGQVEDLLAAFEKDGKVDALVAGLKKVVEPVNPQAEEAQAVEIMGPE
jgi:phosphopantetheine adenylyltransferase